jgi:hypothetical protein
VPKEMFKIAGHIILRTVQSVIKVLPFYQLVNASNVCLDVALAHKLISTRAPIVSMVLT